MNPLFYTQSFGDISPFPWWLLVLILVWTLPWKGYALWKSARNGQIAWFVVLLVVNTLAILEILYLKFWQRKIRPKDERETEEGNKS